MNRMLNDRFGNKPKSKKKGCLFLILGSLLALLATGLYVLCVSLLTGPLIEARHGGEIAYALMDLVTPSYMVAMLFFYGILAVWYFTPNEEEVKKQNQSLSPMLGQKPSTAVSKRTLWLITAGMLCGVVVTGAVALNTYRLVTPDGIRSYFFAETGSYEWKQVSAYTIDCESEEDGLSVTFTMRDGKKLEILQGVNSATKSFKETYTSVTHFAAELDSRIGHVKLVECFSGIMDLSFMGFQGEAEELEALAENMPGWGTVFSLPMDDLLSLDVPIASMGTSGKDAHKDTERLELEYSFRLAPQMLERLIARLGEDSEDAFIPCTDSSKPCM